MGRTYAEAVSELERAMCFGVHPSLDGIRALTSALGRPQDSFESVQVTGTNGKTSVTRMIAAMLGSQGLRTLAFTSPHLESYTERMAIDGVTVDGATFAAAVDAALGAAGAAGGDVTEFELLTAGALWLARERGCAWAVLEVGMGGRWDATSVVAPAVAVITGVGLDHMDRLGDTVEAIAFDKAHVIKQGSTAVLGPGTEAVRDAFVNRALDVGGRVVEVRPGVEAGAGWTFDLLEAPAKPGGRIHLAVRGPFASYDDLSIRAPSYQAENVATALAAACEALGRAIDPSDARETLEALTFPGRFELVQEDPPVVLDGAHNPAAAAMLATAIAEAWPDPDSSPVALVGVLADKDAESIVRELAPVVSGFICTSPDSPRALSAGELAGVVERVTGRPCPTVPLASVDAAWVASAAPQGLVVTGSLYTAGGIRPVWGRHSGT